MNGSTKTLRICLIQFAVPKNREDTHNHLRELVSKAVTEHQPRVIALPECFTIPYDTSLFTESAEEIPNGKTSRVLSELAKQFGIYIVGGSIIERDGANLHNTCTIWGPTGALIATHRKAHLCNINIENVLVLDEVSTLTAGNDVTTFQVDGIKCGVCICYDAYFDEFVKSYTKLGCDVMFVPAAYDIDTAPDEWELVHRARAFDNQMYVAAISPARDEKANYVVWGHSMVIDARGKILKQADCKEEIICCDLDLDLMRKMRKEMPLLTSRRTDIYEKY